MTSLAIALRTRTFRSLSRHRNYRIFFAGQLVSLAGSWMQNVALAWLVLELSGSPLAVGALVFWRFVPFTVFGLAAGVVADRVDSRKLVMATQGVALIVSVALAVITLTGTATLPIVYVLAALGGVTLAFDAPGRQSLTYQMVGPRSLPNAVALNAGLFNGSRVIGPAIAGVVIAVAGTGICFVINAFSFLAVLAALASLRQEELHPVERDPSARIVDGMRRALRFVRHDRQLRSVLGVVTVISTVGFNFHVLVPLLAADTLHVGPEGFGLLSASFGLGALVGALVTATLPKSELAAVRDRRDWLRRPRARAGPGRGRRPRGAAPLRGRHLVHALHRQRERARPTRGAGSPTREDDRPLPLRVRGSCAGGRAAHRLAGRHRRNAARLRRRGRT